MTDSHILIITGDRHDCFNAFRKMVRRFKDAVPFDNISHARSTIKFAGTTYHVIDMREVHGFIDVDCEAVYVPFPGRVDWNKLEPLRAHLKPGAPVYVWRLPGDRINLEGIHG